MTNGPCVRKVSDTRALPALLPGLYVHVYSDEAILFIFFQNRLANQSQNASGAFTGPGNERSFRAFVTRQPCTYNCIFSIRGPVVDRKYACLINFPIRHAFEHVMLYTILKLKPSTSFTTCQFMT